MKYLSVFLSFMFIFCLVGCNADTTDLDPPSTADATEISTEEMLPSTADATEITTEEILSSTVDTTVNDTEETIQSDVLKVYGTGFGLDKLRISEEQANTVKEIWENCEWADDVTETVYDYVFIDGDREVRYSYDEGIFNDVTNIRSLILTSELRTEINNIVDHLIVLPDSD